MTNNRSYFADLCFYGGIILVETKLITAKVEPNRYQNLYQILI